METVSLAPLEDPAYEPRHPPVGGLPPDVVAKWGPRSQMRWFGRYRDQLRPMPWKFWERFYFASAEHRGNCCSSCIEDKNEGYGWDIEGCCCAAMRERTES